MCNKLAYQFETETYNQRGLTVFNENTPADHVAFIKSGEFEIFKAEFTEDDREILDFLDDQLQTQTLLRGSQTVFKKTTRLSGPTPSVR